MNDGQYTNLRNYLEEIASLQRQAVQLLERIVAPPPTVKKLSDAPYAGTLETEPPPDAHLAAVTQNVLGKGKGRSEAKPMGNVTTETVKEAPGKTTETVEVKEPVQAAVQPPSFTSKPGQTVTPSSTPTMPASGAKGK